MPSHCPICQQDFRIEQGFYSGALWTSFPFVIILMVVFWLILYLYLGLSELSFFFIASFVTFGLQPIIMRLGRAIWINIFVRYRGK